MYYLLWLVGILIGLNVIFWLMRMGFHVLYPPTAITKNLIPFQNNYLALTDAFLTIEMGSSEFTDDPGPVSRLVFSGGLVVAATILLLIVMAIVPFLRSLAKHVGNWFVLPLLLLALLHSACLPPRKTVINNEARQLELTDFSWGFIPQTTNYPFTSVRSFSYELKEVFTHDHNYTIYARLLADVDGQQLLIGENEVGYHEGAQEDHENWHLPTERKQEIDNAIEALYSLTGVKR